MQFPTKRINVRRMIPYREAKARGIETPASETILVDATLTIDIDRLIDQLAGEALGNKSKKSTLGAGAIVVSVAKV